MINFRSRGNPLVVLFPISFSRSSKAMSPLTFVESGSTGSVGAGRRREADEAHLEAGGVPRRERRGSTPSTTGTDRRRRADVGGGGRRRWRGPAGAWPGD